MSEENKAVELKDEEMQEVSGGETSGTSLLIKVSKGFYKENDTYYYLDHDYSAIIGSITMVDTKIYLLHSTMGIKYIKYSGTCTMFISELAKIGRVPDEEVPAVNLF